MPANANKTRDALIARIRQDGPVSVAAYMEAAATAYYAARDPFGMAGDFTTAPEISQMFGDVIGAWCTDIWMQMGKPENIKLIELGPGRGTLAADILRATSRWFRPELHLVETSPTLREVQKQKVQAQWHDRLEDVPEGPSILIANEFFDALPIHQFVQGQERLVGYDESKDAFFFTHDGEIRETCPAAINIVQQIARRGGVALFIDYGYAEGSGDTLQSLSRHKYTDPLEAPGEHDITAHVDFAALRAAAAPFADVAGPVTQGAFLLSLGIAARAEKLGDPAALHRLTAPDEMGTLFKVMALTPKGGIIRPAGFS